MEKLSIWPEVLDWREVGLVFVIMSIIALFVSSIINKYLKNFPVLATQLSILVTLAIYPMVNFYTLVAADDDVFNVLGRADPSNYGACVFFAPLPVCVFIAAVFFTFRNWRMQKKPSLQWDKSKLIGKAVPCILSLTIGSTWLSVNMLFNRDTFPVTVIMFMFYTVLGFVMYLVSAAVLFAVRRLIVKCDGKDEC